MIQIIPSILDASTEDLQAHIIAVQDHVNMIQIDIADGEFVPSTTASNPDIVKKIATIDIELHLMVKKPLLELKKWATVEQVTRVLVHYESMPDIHDIFPTLHAYGWDISMVINPDTPISALEPFVPELKGVMCMGVIPGFQGSPFVPGVLGKLKEIKSRWPQLFLELDGGVNEETIDAIIETGLDAVCPGSAIFKNNRTPGENVSLLREHIRERTR